MSAAALADWHYTDTGWGLDGKNYFITRTAIVVWLSLLNTLCVVIIVHI